MTYTTAIETGYLFNNADVLNKIILDRNANYSVSNALCHRLAVTENTGYALAHAHSGNSCTLNRELMAQVQNFQVIINLLTELRR
jgi:hypothetical protein